MPARRNRGNGLFQVEMSRILSRMGNEVKDNRRQELLVRKPQKKYNFNMKEIVWLNLGLVPFQAAWGLQKFLVDQKKSDPHGPGFLNLPGYTHRC